MILGLNWGYVGGLLNGYIGVLLRYRESYIRVILGLCWGYLGVFRVV